MSDDSTSGDGGDELGDFTSGFDDEQTHNEPAAGDDERDARETRETPTDTEITTTVEFSEEVENRLDDLRGRVEEVEAEADRLEPVGEENPIDLDPRVGAKDLCFDRAKPGAKVYVVDVLAESVPDYYEAFPDAPALDDYAGNVVTRFRDADAVFACVYVKDSLTSVDTNLTAYPMPESRLTRFPAEEASMVGGAEVEFDRTDTPATEPEADEETPEEAE